MPRLRLPDADAPSVPLVCTADDALLDVLLDWCSALGAVPDVARDPGTARRTWRSARWVLVGDDVVGELAADPPTRRPGVFVVARPDISPRWDLAMAIGAEEVLDPTDRGHILRVLTTAVDGRGDACVVAVMGGVGGAGASCFASALAVESGRRGLRTLLIDGDPLGGGIDLLLGVESVDGLRWPDVGPQSGALTAQSLADALPSVGNVWVLAAGRRAERDSAGVGAAGILAAARRGFDVVVCDVGRHIDARASDLLAGALLTVVVVPEDVRAVAASLDVVERLRLFSSSLAAVVAHRRPGLSRDAVADALGIPVVGRIRHDRRLQGALDHGAGLAGSAALRRAVRPIADLVAAP